jgi:uncharacterized protein YcbX
MGITLSALHIYPVKGLKGIQKDEAVATERGLEHDRRWMVVDAGGQFISQRSQPRMATIWTDLSASTLELSAPDAGSVEIPLHPGDAPALAVQVWNSACEAVLPSPAADAWLSEYLGAPLRLVYMPDSTRRLSNREYAGEDKLVSFADGYAFLAIGEASLADLNARLTLKHHPALPMNRFRPNFVVAGSAAYTEDAWRQVRIGGAAFRNAKPCGRCQVTTTDQTTGEIRGPEPLATLSTYRDSSRFGVMFGTNLVSVSPGRLRVGDAVELEN